MDRRTRSGWLCAVALCGAACGAGPAPADDAASPLAARAPASVALALSPGAHTFGADADATASERTPDVSEGSALRLVVDGAPRREAYLRFQVTGLHGASVMRAFLRLSTQGGTPDGPRVYVADSRWSESTLTWNRRPALRGAPLADLGFVGSYATVDVDVTPAVRGEGAVTFALVADSARALTLHAREQGGGWVPELVVETDEVPVADASTRVLPVVEDTWVDARMPGTRHGASPRLTVASGPDVQEKLGYLKLRVPDVPLPLFQARVRLFVSDGTDRAPSLTSIDPRWSADRVTWRTRPGRGTGGGAAPEGPVAAGRWLDFDVTQALKGPGDYAFGLFPDSQDAVSFHSAESPSEALRPQLVLTYGAPEACGVRRYRRSGSQGLFADAWVSRAQPNENFGDDPVLRVGTSPETRAFLGTDELPFYQAALTLESVKLRLFAEDGSADGPRLYAVRGALRDSTLTWNAQPALEGPPLGDVGAVASGGAFEYDVTDSFHSRLAASFALVADGPDALRISAWEGRDVARRPRLDWVATETYCERWGPGGDVARVWRYGAAGNERAVVSAATPDGGLVVVGAGGDGVSYGGPVRSGVSVVAAYDAEGRYRWSFALPPRTYPLAVAATAQGEVLVAGVYQGAVDLGGGPLPPVAREQGGAFALRLSSQGAHVQSQGFVASPAGARARAQLWVTSVTSDAAGDLVFGGSFQGRWPLGDEVLEETGDGAAAYVVTLAQDGQVRWARALGSALALDALAAAADGRVYVMGAKGARETRPPFHPAVLALSPSGEPLWQRVLEGATGSVADAALTADGALAIAGRLSGVTTFAGRVLQGGAIPEGRAAVFIAKLGADGRELWAHVHGELFDATGVVDVFALPDGGFGIAGLKDLPLDLGGGPLGPVGRVRMGFVATYDADGGHRWSRALDRGLRFASAVPSGTGVTVVGSLRANRSARFDGMPVGPFTSDELLLVRLRE